MSDIQIRTLSTLERVNSADWDQLDHGASPFLKHGFLLALEQSNSVGPQTGWLPSYLLVEREGELLGACAAYVKTDSYGEYIFDWAWARAAPRFGVNYYPKLVVAAPFTPASGNRLLIAPGQDRGQVQAALIKGIGALVEKYKLSSAHILFCSQEEAMAMEASGLARRSSYQFHWRNREYANFDEFLSELKSRKRKQIRKERQRAQAAVDSIEFVFARDMTEKDLEALNRFYRKTVAEHGGYDYLRPGFFEAARRLLPDTMLFCRVSKQGEVVAGAIFFETKEALYGRYWGSEASCEFLHFEVAYYAAIERCIDRKIPLFEAGAQGQHKLVRGFEPALTYSCHLVADADFDHALRGFLIAEEAEVEQQMRELAATGPYREASDDQKATD